MSEGAPDAQSAPADDSALRRVGAATLGLLHGHLELLGIELQEQKDAGLRQVLCAGVALIDYDSDGLLDILFVTGDRYEQITPKPRLHLYRNLGKLKFEDVTAKAGLGHTGWGQGVAAGDIDNDCQSLGRVEDVNRRHVLASRP